MDEPELNVDFVRDDLSLGAQPARDIQADNMQLEEYRHRQTLQRHLFRLSAFLALVLFTAASFFGWMVLHYPCGQYENWHIYLLPGSFLVPPSIIMLALIRSIYVREGEKPATTEALPALSLIKEIAQALAEAMKGLKAAGKD